MGLLNGTRLVALDTETTGFGPGSALVEVASVTLESGELGEQWSSLVRPGRPIPPDAVGIHGITDAMVADAPEPCAIAGRLRAACGDLPLISHNAPFDLPFLQELMRSTGQKPLFNPVVDTLGLARGLFGSGGNKLEPLALRLGIQPEETHRALGDARTTAKVFVELARRWEEDRDVRSLAELAALSQDVMRLTARR